MCLVYSNRNQPFLTCVCVPVCVCVCVLQVRGQCLTTQILIKVTLALTFGKQKLTIVGKQWSD